MPRILLVEDNDMNRDMLGRRLARRGYEVLFAADGREGVRQALTAKPDLILMDLSLPVMDGWQATRLLKAEPSTSTIPVIALTAHAMARDRESALAAGYDEFETKPVELGRLIERMESLLGRSETNGKRETDPACR